MRRERRDHPQSKRNINVMIILFFVYSDGSQFLKQRKANLLTTVWVLVSCCLAIKQGRVLKGKSMSDWSFYPSTCRIFVEKVNVEKLCS